MSGSRYAHTTTSRFPTSLSPRVTNRDSSAAAGSSRVSARSSSSTVTASAKLTPWARRFAFAFGGSHSNRTPPAYRRLSSRSSGARGAIVNSVDPSRCGDPARPAVERPEGVGSLRARSAWNDGTVRQPVARTASLLCGTVASGPKGRSTSRGSGAPWAEDPVDHPDSVCDQDAGPPRHDADTIGPRRGGCKDGPDIAGDAGRLRPDGRSLLRCATCDTAGAMWGC